MKRTLLLPLLLLTACATTATQPPPPSPPYDCQPGGEPLKGGDEDPPVFVEEPLVEAELPPLALSPCPDMEWADCLAWAVERSINYEQKWQHCTVEAERLDGELRDALAVQPVPVKKPDRTLFWVGATAFAAAVSFATGWVVAD